MSRKVSRENKQKKPIKRSKPKAVKIEVEKTDYLSHSFSPHLVDLRKFAPPEPQEFFVDLEPPESYFEQKEDLADFPVGQLPPDRLGDIIKPNLDEEIRQKISQIRREIEEMEDIVEEVFNKEGKGLSEVEEIIPELPSIEPVREIPSVFRVRRVVGVPFVLTKKVVIYFNFGVNRLVQPLRDASLSAKNKALIGFVVLALLLILPIGGISYYQNLKGIESGVLSFGRAAAESLGFAGKAVSSKDYIGANQQFNSAYQKFSAAQNELNSINKLVTTLAEFLPVTEKALETAESLVVVGQDLSVVGQNLVTGLASWEDKGKTMVEKISTLRLALEESAPLVENVEEQVAKIDIAQLPAEEQFKFMQLQDKMPLVADSFNNFISLAKFFEDVLGKNELKRYLIVFQNNHEIRPTGGFIGSFALLDLVNGEIKNLEIPRGGSYDLQGSLKTNVATPAPLRLASARWEFQDSNWFPDWPTAAEKIIWFYNQSGGPTVDGLIAINASLVEDLLEIIGPVAVDDKRISAANFFDVTQKAVELEYDKEANRPKEFIANMAPEVLSKVLGADKDKLLTTISLLNRALKNKDLQLYFVDSDLKSQLADFNWTNDLKEVGKDYLMVVNANIGGQKSDAVITQKILHQATINNDGRVRDKITIIRNHQGVAGELFYGQTNVNYLRVYVPAGSRLVAASGFGEMPTDLFDLEKKVYQQDSDLVKISGLTKTDKKTGIKVNNEFGKTVFGGWLRTEPGETSVVTLEYELPFQVSFAKYQTHFSWLNKLEEKLNLSEATTDYSLVVQKQSGVTSEFYSLVNLPANWQKIWQYPEKLQVASGSLTYSDYLDQDKVYSVMFSK